jgi:oxygen-independent coproporphyrinogen-3 oxidase
LTESFSLYLHIPFCTAKCDYCDFYSVPLQRGSSIIDRYIGILLKETERQFMETERQLETERRPVDETGSVTVPSIYIGGGTPSLLGAGGISRLLEGLLDLLKRSSALSSPGEITVEANPETADDTFLRSCADHGVTRLSLGVQSFDPGFREFLGRRTGRHVRSGWVNSPGKGVALLRNRIAAAAEIFGSGLCLDLISGGIYPENGSFEQKRDMLLRDIGAALSYRPGHVSLYTLTVGEGTPLAARLGKRETPPGDQADRLWLAGREALTNAGFEQYEVSNFALQDSAHGNRCIHNIRYWRMNNWIGVGPGASGTIIAKDGTGLRRWYAPDTEGFLSGKPVLLTEELDRPTVIKETLLMGYRYREGPDPELFARRFGKTIEETIPRTLKKWQNGMDDAAFREKCMLFLNSFLLDAFMELDT